MIIGTLVLEVSEDDGSGIKEGGSTERASEVEDGAIWDASDFSVDETKREAVRSEQETTVVAIELVDMVLDFDRLADTIIRELSRSMGSVKLSFSETGDLAHVGLNTEGPFACSMASGL